MENLCRALEELGFTSFGHLKYYLPLTRSLPFLSPAPCNCSQCPHAWPQQCSPHYRQQWPQLLCPPPWPAACQSWHPPIVPMIVFPPASAASALGKETDVWGYLKENTWKVMEWMIWLTVPDYLNLFLNLTGVDIQRFYWNPISKYIAWK